MGILDPDVKISRTLTLLTKVMQNLANLVLFKSKEAYLQDMNPLLEEYFPKMKAFLDKLAHPSLDEYLVADDKPKLVVQRDMALILRYFIRFRETILGNSMANAEKMECSKDLLLELNRLEDKCNNFLYDSRAPTLTKQQRVYT